MSIQGRIFSKALCDPGLGVSLMPLSVAKSLDLVNGLRYTPVALQLADKSIVKLDRIIEDVLVQVDKFLLPTNFIVLEMQEDKEVPLILGRPFLATGDATLKVKDNMISFNIQGEIVSFEVEHGTEDAKGSAKYFRVDVVENGEKVCNLR
ncbi:retropepsin-like aspartic protease, partial [Candidatus Burkholderia verschuerenii]|uniref:retropepsin-like aspartic protease n=1 Tax=Candidatus Burkholderia verschuerenii TaxID=242163 RepID=UPI000AD12D7D